MKTRGFKIAVSLVVVTLLAGTIAVYAQNGTHANGPTHSHKAHHGGTVKSAGDYHIELVQKGDKYIIYLLDTREKTIDITPVTGLAILRDGDVTTGSHRLKPTGNSHFEIPLNSQAHTAIIITFKINNQSLVAKFDKDKAHALNFYCPQKCVGSDSNLAGTCPKCGTALVDRRLMAKEN